MANYRCYCLDRHGCIRAVTAIAADTDERARASAAVLLTTCAHEMAEIWDGRRRVCTIESKRHNEVVATATLRRNQAPASQPRRSKTARTAREDLIDRNYL
jgi:hypothetical protein